MTSAQALPYIKCFLLGLRDSLTGVLTFFKPIYGTTKDDEQSTENTPSDGSSRVSRRTRRTKSTQSYKEIYSMMIQCCILNGGIFWMSILLFENLLIPILQNLTNIILKTITSTEANPNGIWRWMAPALSYIFRAFWVIPLFWLTKPLNNLWYQEIADLAYRKRSGKPTVLLSNNGSLTQNLSVTIADILFSLLIQGFFLLQASLIYLLPIVGPLLSLLHMTLLQSLYSFEYTWVNKGWRVNKRLYFIECNWPYFIGFGFPLTILTSVSTSFVISGCVFAILFPLFIVSANEAQPIEMRNPPVRIFSFSIWITNKIFRYTWSKFPRQSTQ